MAVKFNLQSVLNYRQSLEDQARQVLAISQQLRVRQESELHQHRDALKKYDQELKLRQREGLSVAEMDVYEAKIYHCRQKMMQLKQQLKQLAQRIDKECKALQQAARDRQIMEKLKDKQSAEYHQELSRKERVMLDEISLRNKGERS